MIHADRLAVESILLEYEAYERGPCRRMSRLGSEFQASHKYLIPDNAVEFNPPCTRALRLHVSPIELPKAQSAY
jgi:hypothetical protein